MNSNKQQVLAGTLIGGRYNIIRPIGQGGMANVYLAGDQTTGGQVAIKIMKDDLTHDQEFIKRFDTEAKAASSLDHPNIVKILGFGQDDNLRYIVQEYVEGSTLKDLIQQRGALDWSIAVPLAIQIGLALEHAHRRGVVHRDIKPHNILITPDMVAKVTDFGIARAVNANTITLTSGMTFGSVHYFSPEQARGSLVGEKSDIYSLGIMLYEMVTGQVPFDGDTSVAVAIKHLQEMPPLPSTIRPGIPGSLDNIIIKCIQKSPENRYHDARELVDELDSFMVEPDGVYGIITNAFDQSGNTTAIGLKRPEPNYSKLREIEKTITERRRSRQRDMAIVISIILLSVVFMVAIGVWGYQKIQAGLQTQPSSEYEVENYIGKEWSKVRPILVAAKINFKEEYKEDDTVPEGIIIDQNPGAGIMIKPNGTTLYIYISGGQDLITIPDYSGDTYTMAEAELEQTYGFKVTLSFEFSDFEKGTVIKTIPAAGQGAPKGSDITLVVSDGKGAVIMPDLAGMAYKLGVEELVKLNLTLGGATSMSVDPLTGIIVDVPEDLRYIIKQSVAPGTEIQARSVIGLTYGTKLDYEQFLNPTPTPEPSPTPTPEPSPSPTPTETAPSDTTTTTETTTQTSDTTTLKTNNGGGPGAITGLFGQISRVISFWSGSGLLFP